MKEHRILIEADTLICTKWTRGTPSGIEHSALSVNDKGERGYDTHHGGEIVAPGRPTEGQKAIHL